MTKYFKNFVVLSLVTLSFPLLALGASGKIDPFASGQTTFTSVPINASAVAYVMPPGSGFCNGDAGFFQMAPTIFRTLDGTKLSPIAPVVVNTAYPFSINPSLGVHTISLSLGWSNPNCIPPLRNVTQVATYNFSVVPPSGTVNVSSNISSSWVITGPATIIGSGTSQSSPAQSTGIYTITWGSVSGYDTPATQSLTLTSGGTITFSGIYSAIPPPVCPNGTNNPTTCTTCPALQAYDGTSCVICNGGCTGAGNTSGTGATCNNGATNPPYCSVCPAGQDLGSGVCATPVSGPTIGDGFCGAGENLTNSPADCKPKTKFWQF